MFKVALKQDTLLLMHNGQLRMSNNTKVSICFLDRKVFKLYQPCHVVECPKENGNPRTPHYSHVISSKQARLGNRFHKFDWNYALLI